ncbi:hypothetical protein [Cerasicoccus frondis]|uniref:hypothetical protein n=1 Tax=Cerasicoccus frondis TaxID=490090 RepID=UPI002852513E|nr:hypothetical protein [Cerasicoccus frondis]
MATKRKTIADYRKENDELRAKVQELEDAMEKTNAQAKDTQGDNTALLYLLADIRKAAGDPLGKLCQDQLVEHIADIRARAEGGGELKPLMGRYPKNA